MSGQSVRTEVRSDADAVPFHLAPRRSQPPAEALGPIGLGVDAGRPDPRAADGDDLVARRERLQRIVVGALGACGLILIAAAGAQVARAAASTAPSQPVAVLTKTSPPDAPTAATAPPAVDPAPAAAPPAPVADAPSIGTLRLHWPAVPGKVWLDDQKIATTSTVVACGKHELRVGAKGAPRAIDIPCGGDFRVTR